ncbi:MAG: hypothetical protein UT41_C0001G0079 [Candidatus Wolfebacteria bacterium GW2011_GWC2_39_22]|uniref:Uncharacterized protein n=1 Tax=Candidatus Wolfebacteria bacterium GW2011_GWC2_39_22 TaxID=1619013 RepID=A0A0G0QQ58_9BACT|nr:MAG: hypothetical protein UT41_C0001G0079 [Candidatus Wolfebacteria bacterium GW2011_GWC2_39_22]HBI25738.1 hypothetical protein [Candidatus Wolfebacteria bacterium]
MKKIDIRKHSYLLFGFACGVTLFAAYIIAFGGFEARNNGPLASAQEAPFAVPPTDPSVRGWMWSSNIGWISLDCRDGGRCGTGAGQANYSSPVNLTTGVVSGYAWSSNIGWIKMNPTGPYPAAPSHGLQANMDTGELSGWIRACAGAANANCSGAAVDGWDGWIQIRDAKVSTAGYITNRAGDDGGWLWGGDVVGWVKTSDIIGTIGTSFPVADCAFRATPPSIIPPQSVKLEWICNDATRQNSCSIDNGGGSNLPTSGNVVMRPTETTPYVLTCQGFGGPVIKNLPVTITKTKIIEVRPGQ